MKITTYKAPDEGPDTEGKFIQFMLDGEEHLVFATFTRHRFHNQILAQFFDEEDIPHHWEGEEELVVDNPSFNPIGGGRYRADSEKKVLRLWNNSQAYGRFREEGLADAIRSAQTAWSTYEIEIG